MNLYLLTYDNLKKLTAELIKSGQRVISPSKDGVRYRVLTSAEELYIDPAAAPASVSMKEFFLPKSETLFYFKKEKDEFQLTDALNEGIPSVILGAKPCDTASLPVLNKVFNWDYKDDFFNNKVDQAVIIGMACSFTDENCFCTSVGLSPDSTRGSDLFLIPLADNQYGVKTVTEKGQRFITSYPQFFTVNIEEPPARKNLPEKRFEPAEIKQWLDHNFNHAFWDELGDNCLGCAQCAFVCPTCHCFDIVDEECSYTCGRRAKNWDACQFELFTKHASGHNPRNDQGKRYRQRISHKFKYYPDKFDEILCTGCGRCSRGCPVLTDIGIILEDINKLAKANTN